jgi:hypothetical protein
MASTHEPSSPNAHHQPRFTSADGEHPAFARAQVRLDDWVAERPWTMVGAAAGLGLALGAASRSRAVGEMSRMVAATASGVAVRLAVNSLTQWFAQATEQQGEPRWKRTS